MMVTHGCLSFQVVLWILLSWCELDNVLALSGFSKVSKKKKNAGGSASIIQTRPVQTNADMIALADLRYQEWMMDDENAETRPSLTAFRMATAEIQLERTEEKAVAFLATWKGGQVVGAAELSPIELKGCWEDDAKPTARFLYVTDVVTARTHRRKGVAAKIMKAVEEHTQNNNFHNDPKSGDDEFTKQLTTLLLHVEPGNVGALRFYGALGYKESSDEDSSVLEGLNVDQLAKNAFVEGQLLLLKTLGGSR
ncbi:expressed unknown protein [Seminavis robusta]|uniref:N-acetyltransferase domain-containing protein n=1 Tax=Seminavis robusta TaxID=568900 RepID=A0A9N8E8T4_9STRA|nr:expressed unknown protein [Seminavis robusta]|eukprot:Sro798_g204040.1 n/a (252) ;mRNA; f:42306-43061